jgi:hypothetical protein
MDRVETDVTSSFMGLSRQGPCPVCGEIIAVQPFATTRMLCPTCGEYLQMVEKKLRRMDVASMMSMPAFAAATPWSDMASPRSETLSMGFTWDELIQEAAQSVLTKNERVRLLNAAWPSGCCVCGEPETRKQIIASTFVFVRPALFRLRERKAKVIAKDIPHCDEHIDGAKFDAAMFSTAGSPTEIGLFFRSYRYQIEFRRLNPWKWADWH